MPQGGRAGITGAQPTPAAQVTLHVGCMPDKFSSSVGQRRDVYSRVPALKEQNLVPEKTHISCGSHKYLFIMSDL